MCHKQKVTQQFLAGGRPRARLRPKNFMEMHLDSSKTINFYFLKNERLHFKQTSSFNVLQENFDLCGGIIKQSAMRFAHLKQKRQKRTRHAC